MIRNINKKIVATLLLTIILISNVLQIFPLLQSNAINVGDSIAIQSIGTVPYHLKSQGLGYVITELAGYYDNGSFYPAYCLESKAHGADSNGGYNVTLTELIKDTETYNKIWRVAVAGYPYHDAQSLGVSDWGYAYQATKMAIYCVTGQAQLSSFYADPGDTIGQSVVNLIHTLVNEGENGSATYKTALAEIKETQGAKLEGDSYTIKYNLESNLNLANYSIAIANFPNNTIVTDLNGNIKNNFSYGEQFQIKIPKEEFETQNINGNIRADIETNDYAIFYGASYNPATQDYALTGDPISLTSCSKSLSIENNKSAIKIYKYNEDKSATIAGVTFELLNEEGTVIKTATTDTNGVVTFEKLFKGTYYVREKNTVTGYLLNDEKKEIQLDFDTTSETTMTNKEPVGELKLIKTDAETGNKDRADKKSHHGDATLEGTVYTLYANEDIYNVARTVKYFSRDDVIGTYNFDSYGNAIIKITNTSTKAKLEGGNGTLKGLPMGSYYAKETTVPVGYLPDTKIYPFTFKYRDMYTELIKIESTVTNQVKKGRFEVIKMSSITNTTAPIIQGAEFTAILTKYVDYYGSFDEALKHLNEFSKDEYSIFTTQSNGHIISGLLAYGKYTVNETYCPSDRINPVKPFEVTIDQESNGPIDELIENDTPFTSYIKLIKKDKKSGKTVTFSNTTFSLYKLNEENKQWERVSCKLGRESYNTWTTDDEGMAYTETKLNAGTYKVEEIVVPDGFIQLDEECIFEVNRSNPTLEYDKDYDAYITVNVENWQPTGTLIIDKAIALRDDIDKSFVDTSDLSGIEFKLTAKEDIIDYADGSLFYQEGQEVTRFHLDKEGNYTLTELPMGSYELQEIRTINGLVLNDRKYEITFTQKDLVTKVYEEKRDVINDTTCVEISKTDITGDKELEGAELSVIDEKGNIIDSWTSSTKTHKIEGLSVHKKYILRENLTPLGYVKSTDIEFTVENTKDIQKVTMIDKVVEMSKKNIAGEELEGAKIQVFNKDNEIIDEWISEKTPHKINNLIENETYTLHEEIAIEGYVKASDIEFLVTTDKETQKIEMIDKIVSLTKADVGGNEIEGAEITVTDEDGEIVDSWTSTKEPHNISNLEENKSYILHEEYAPEGYVVATDIKFTVTTDKETQEIILVDKIVEMSKQDISGNEIKGATMVVTSTKTKNIVDKWVSGTEPHKISGLIEGESYILHEEICADGYVKASDIEFSVTTDKETQKVIMIDKMVDVTKTDLIDGEEIEGAELVITDEDGNIIDEWTSTKEPHHVSGLEENKTYTLTEKTAPYGYEIAESITFTVSTDKETQIIEMKDKPYLASVQVEKIDKATGEHIKSNKFTFGLFEDAECTKLISEVGANEYEGTALFENLKYGTYYIKELKAPLGYKLSKQVVKIEFNENGVFADGVSLEQNNNIYSFVYYNSLNPITYPLIQTGNEMNYILLATLMGLSLIGITTGIVVLKRKNRKDN